MEPVRSNDTDTGLPHRTADVALYAQSELSTTDTVQAKGTDLIATRSSTDNPHACSSCGKIFPLLKTLKRHMEKTRCARAFGHEATVYQCSTCREYFSRNDVLLRHKETKHRSVKESCRICGKSISKRALPEHYRARTCKAMQSLQAMRRLEIAKQIQSSKASTATFTSDTLLHPLFTSYRLLHRLFHPCGETQARTLLLQHLSTRQTLVTQQQKEEEVCSDTFWITWRIAVKEASRILSENRRTQSCALVAIVLTLSMLDSYMTDAGDTEMPIRALERSSMSGRDANFGKIRVIIHSAFSAFGDVRGAPSYWRIAGCRPHQGINVDGGIVFFLGLLLDLVGLVRGSEVDIKSECVAQRQEIETELCDLEQRE